MPTTKNVRRSKIPGKLGIFIGKVYRAYMKSEEGRGIALSSKQRDTQ
jgi:hypothetical protein